MMFIVFDIGGSKTRVACSRDCEAFVADPIVFTTPGDFDEGVREIAAAARELAKGDGITRAIGGIAGTFNHNRSELLRSPNLTHWAGKPLLQTLEEALEAPATLENDSALVGLGEACRGAGRGHDIVAYLTVSTGVGGARIVNGTIDTSAQGFEPGNHIIDVDKTACPDCGASTAEGYLSGKALLERAGVSPREVMDEKVWAELSEWLAYLVHNATMFWSPDVVILGGPMIVGDPAISIESMKEKLASIRAELGFPKGPEIKKAELEDFGGLYGALELAKSGK